MGMAEEKRKGRATAAKQGSRKALLCACAAARLCKAKTPH